MVISQEYADVPVGERAMRTFVAAPRAPGRYPGVVFYSDIFQLTESTLRWCARLAGHGFVVAAPEIYHRDRAARHRARVRRRGQARADRRTRRRRRSPTSTRTSAPRSTGWRPTTAWTALCATGHCTGGHLGFRAAFDPRVRATALWYPTGLHDGELGKDADAGSLARASEIRGEMLLIFGTNDPHTPRGPCRHQARARGGGRSFRWSLYEAEHAFGRDIARATTPRRPTRRSPRPSRC